MTIWRWERDGFFPRHLSINSRNYWRLTELRDWMDRQQSARQSADAVSDARDTFNATDFIFRGQGGTDTLVTLKQEGSSYLASLVIGIDRAGQPTRNG